MAEKGLISSYMSKSQSVTGAKQGRNPIKNLEAETEAQTQRNVASWLAPHASSACFLTQSGTTAS